MMRASRRWVVGGAAAVSLALGGDPGAATAQEPARAFVLIVSGSSGDPSFATRFGAEAMAFRGALSTRVLVPDSQVTWLAEDPATNPAAIAGKSTRDGITQALERLASRVRAGDLVFILLLGHGSSQDDVSRFNIPGQDISDADFATLLSRFSAQRVAFVNTTSASGDFIKRLSAPNRVVVTATKTGFERNESIFSAQFISAYAKDGADTDKDGRVSLLEAFTYAHREVQRSYEQDNKLQTEHALLDDDGDGIGHGDPGDKGPDGLRARGFFLASTTGISATVASDPRAKELIATQQRLQLQIDSVRALKGSMTEDALQKALEPLLIKLAETAQALRALAPKKP